MVPETKRPLKVFLCHASGDKPAVRELYRHLVAEGVDAWLDQEKLLPGQDWRLEIPKAVEESDVVVICLSPKSVTKEGYIQKEIKFALDVAEEKPDGAIFLIPARLEDCPVPSRFSRWQWVDLFVENGFSKLLRSLKLRAAAVGAVIEPHSAYEDSDKELGRRIDQLYTEGLAAFYTEDWERACHRFQSILSEIPNHQNAAEKLIAAERQRDLAKSYAQALELVQSEDWCAAIKTLEGLSQKSADYKDVIPLLRNARKQKQLQELYAEARRLHTGQKWQAVVKVFDQISLVEPNYADADGLLPSARKEVAELQRVEELNDRYSRALREMDAGHWMEARELLEQVHKSQARFLETEPLLRKVEQEIATAEEIKRRNEKINVLYEQAHGLLRSNQWRNALEKIEEIETLKGDFEDKDGIAQKARAELELEHNEAQRQNQLAALYAQAVRLLKEEHYQEALDKWQEVKTVDPKYPDRQSVQSTATNYLMSKAGKPASLVSLSRKQMFAFGGGISVFGLFMIAVLLLNRQSPTVLPEPSSTPTPTKIRATATAVSPSPTNSPTAIPPTATIAIPTMTIASPILFSENFENSSYEGKFDSTRWVKDTSNPGFTVQQTGGSLLLMRKGVTRSPSFLEVKSLPRFPSEKSVLIQTDMKIEKDSAAGLISLHLRLGDVECICYLDLTPKSLSKQCSYGAKYFSIANVTVGTWHTVGIEIDPVAKKLVFFLDGKQTDTFAVPANNSLAIKTVNILFLSESNSINTKGYIDNFVIEQK